jgi:hypothetical protein
MVLIDEDSNKGPEMVKGCLASALYADNSATASGPHTFHQKSPKSISSDSGTF